MSVLDDVTSITNSASSTTAAKSTPRKTASTLGIEDFLTLMTSQLKNQDPLKPMDSTAFVAQLAQFGTVSGIQGMESNLTALSSALRSSQMLSGASLVGHQITTASSSAQYRGSGSLSGSVDVPSDAVGVQVVISDASGQAVRHIAVNPTTGMQAFSWDGRSDSGEQLGAGSYTLQALSSTGSSNTSLQTYLNGRVSSVSMNVDDSSLTVNTVEFGATALSDVRQVI